MDKLSRLVYEQHEDQLREEAPEYLQEVMDQIEKEKDIERRYGRRVVDYYYRSLPKICGGMELTVVPKLTRRTLYSNLVHPKSPLQAFCYLQTYGQLIIDGIEQTVTLINGLVLEPVSIVYLLRYYRSDPDNESYDYVGIVFLPDTDTQPDRVSNANASFSHEVSVGTIIAPEALRLLRHIYELNDIDYIGFYVVNDN